MHTPSCPTGANPFLASLTSEATVPSGAASLSVQRVLPEDMYAPALGDGSVTAPSAAVFW